MKTLKPTYRFLIGILLILSAGCKKEILVDSRVSRPSLNERNLAVTPYTFNWETVDWMPTPPGQSQIPPPWIGQGSIAGTYGADIVNDHKAADGWALVYNTFNPNAPGSLVNPYFMLYNKYRGLLRIYFFVTTPFVYPSTYIVDGLQVVSSSKSSNMLNYLGTDLVYYGTNQTLFNQIEPAPLNGSQPLASNKWYMLQYEIAYDPNMSTYGYQDIQLSWFMNFNSVSTISLGGTATGTIKTATGAQSSALPSALQKGGQVLGTSALSIIGAGAVQSAQIDTTGKNNMGLSPSIFKAVLKGVTGAVSAATGGIAGAIVNIFSAVIGGSSNSPTVNLDLNASINLSGTQTTAGSFPSSPTSVYVPGTVITQAAQNYIPLYNSTLGVFYLSSPPQIICKHSTDNTQITTTTYSLTASEISGTNLIFNPAVTGAAKIQNIKEEIVLIDPNKTYPYTWSSDAGSYYGFFASTGTKEQVGNHTVYSGTSFIALTQGLDYWDNINGIENIIPGQEVNSGLGVRVTFDVVPNGGAPKSTIVKTFNGPYYQTIIEQ
jgi:hypothetical protein